MPDSAKYSRLTENPATHQKGTTAAEGNPGVFVRNQTINGVPYARIRAEKGTWVSASMKKLGYDRLYGKDTAFGAYTGIVLGPDGRSLSTPDRIRPGQEYLVPIPPERQERRGGLPLAEEQPSQILEFLTGRGQTKGGGRTKGYPGDPPPDVPPNVTKITTYFKPSFIAGFPVSVEEEIEIKRWIYDACRYNDVPVVLMAVILQQENGSGASIGRKQLQAGERESQTTLAQLEERLGVRLPGILGKAAGGSTGIANLSRATLRNAASYLETVYHRPPIPDSIRKEKGDPRIAGIDEQIDLYYMSALLRQLIDHRVKVGYSGNLTDEQLRLVARDYNGSGKDAEKYGSDALAKLKAARHGKAPLRFLGTPPVSPLPPGNRFRALLDQARGLGF
jgi:hypothetical protein